MDSHAPFACLLVGQPTLRRRIRLGAFAALDQRVALRYAMTGMDAAETADYVAHHLKIAGRSDTLFSDDALALIHQVSRGLPRAVNNLAVQSLVAAFAENKSDRRRVLGPGRGHRGDGGVSPGAPRTELVPPEGWLSPPDPAAYQGLAGALVEAIAPHTEADPVAILAQLLVAAGAMVGRGAYFCVEATRHHPGEFVVLVGESAKARKGSSWDHVARLMARADPGFPSRVSAGLSSGEGLVWALRDARGADPGVTDPRLLVVEPEFASVLKACSASRTP